MATLTPFKQDTHSYAPFPNKRTQLLLFPNESQKATHRGDTEGAPGPGRAPLDQGHLDVAAVDLPDTPAIDGR